MGTNTLTTATDGTVIPASNHNGIVTALTEHLVPRDPSTRAPGDLEGNLGSSSYRWAIGYIKSLILGNIASLISIEEDAGALIIKTDGSTVFNIDTDGMTVKVDGSTLFNIDSTGFNFSMVGSQIFNTASTGYTFKIGASSVVNIDSGGIVGTSMKTATIPKNKMVVLDQQISSSSGTYSRAAPATTYADVTNLSVTITTTGRPVYLFLFGVGLNNSAPSAIYVRPVGASPTARLKFVRGSTDININIFGDNSAGASTFYQPIGAFTYIDTPSAGTYTYKVQMSTSSTNTYDVQDVKLCAYEL